MMNFIMYKNAAVPKNWYFRRNWCKELNQKNVSDIVTMSAKGATFRCVLMGISKNEGLKRLNNSVTYDRGVL